MALVLDGGEEALACALFVVAAVTDYLDGYLARRWEVTTTLGSFLDTTADKLLVSGVLIALVSAERASAWIAMIIVARELVILGLRGAIAVGGTVMQPSMLGKTKTAVQFLAIAVAIVRPGSPVGGMYVDEWLMLLAGAITLGSAIDYLARSSSAFSTRPA
jgi:CDP-diacylglycerol--glycerol-3-phosphate 3-phosphatidyltransferase